MNRKKSSTATLPTNLSLFEQEFIVQPPRQEQVGGGFLPSVDELYSRFHSFNVKYFAGKLPTPRIRYSSRMLCAGQYIRSRVEIVLSSKYHELFPEDIDDTLKHEMIHIIHFNHNADFRREAERIGASVKAKAHNKLRLPSRYVYQCKACKTEYPRRKRLISASCGKCSPNRFDPRFKLSLKKKLT
jgi:predicted SprT family Zn-dependent metalloprotease